MPIVGAVIFPLPILAFGAYKAEEKRRLNRILKSGAQPFAGQPQSQKGVTFGTWDARNRQFQANPEFQNVFGQGNPAGPTETLTPDQAYERRVAQVKGQPIPTRNGTVTPTAPYAGSFYPQTAPCTYAPAPQVAPAASVCNYGTVNAGCTYAAAPAATVSPCTAGGYYGSPVSTQSYIPNAPTAFPMGSPNSSMAMSAPSHSLQTYNEADVYAH